MSPDAPRTLPGPDAVKPCLETGLYDRVLTEVLEAKLRELPQLCAHLEALDLAEAPGVLARHLAGAIRVALSSISDLSGQIQMVNRILEDLDAELRKVDARGAGFITDERVTHEAQRLVALQDVPTLAKAPAPPVRPGIPLGESALLVNARHERRVGSEIERELESADRVDLICSFLKWSGYRLLEPAIARLLQSRRKELRVLTTCYTGATERRVLDRLVALGAQVRVSYDTRRTRLHAKAWLFHRNTGFTTAYIGSSNLSSAALVDGMEWNVRVSAVDLVAVVDAFRATFDSYWQDGEFEPYDPSRDSARFDRAVRNEQGEAAPEFVGLDVMPYPFQSEILERLHVERFVHQRWKNLIVAATGTGKTVIAALDYRRMRQDLGDGRLLFVAHREEILRQSRSVFRTVLRDAGFGEVFVGGTRPEEGRHVFASVQSLARVDLDQIPPDAFDMVIVDEFHHAEAPTYERLLSHLNPRLLLGLTATPERADGQSILHWFGDRIAAELRLWEALERNLLCPFQYFGIGDEVDLSEISWRSGRYDPRELDNLFTGDHARARRIAQAVHAKVADIRAMRALGFCVSVRHAQFMAEQFSSLGIPSVAIHGESLPEERRAALSKLARHPQPAVNVVFAVDLFNEGVDVPQVNTVLFLRPTESATVFQQQLGRGLRIAEGKDCLTVLDFIGHQHAKFRFDLRFRALTGGSRAGVMEQVKEDFPRLPPGCVIQLDEVAKGRVLANLRAVLQANITAWIGEIRNLGPRATLAGFLTSCDLGAVDLYRGGRCWSSLRRSAGIPTASAGPDEQRLQRGLARLLHLDDAGRFEAIRKYLVSDVPPQLDQLDTSDARHLEMLTTSVWGRGTGMPVTTAEALDRLWQHPAIREEILELASHLEEQLDHDVHESPVTDVPLNVHGHYSLAEILVAFGRSEAARQQTVRQGVYRVEEARSDLLFVTLHKTEKDYSPSTMYRDYAISPELFHWESQSTTALNSPTGRRYREHQEMGDRIVMFVRESKKDARGETMPYTFLGEADFVSHTGERPMQIVWKLRRPMPAEAFDVAKAVG